MKAYKLTRANNQTLHYTKWGENVTHSATGTGKGLCSTSWIHFYTDPILAVLMNRLHADFISPNLWECETSGEHLFEPLKAGCKTLTTIRQIPLPNITRNQKIAFCLLCAKVVCRYSEWHEWANNWLNNVDRTTKYDNYMHDAVARSAMDIAESRLVDIDFRVAYLAFIVTREPVVDFPAIANKAMTYS